MTRDAQEKDERVQAGEESVAGDGAGSTPKDATTEADAGASLPRDHPVDPRIETVRALAQRIKALRF